MPGAFFKRELRQPIALDVAGQAPVEGVLTAIKVLAPAGEPWTADVCIDVDVTVFFRVEDEHLFGFTPESIDPSTTGWEFTSAGPVELQLRLNSRATRLLGSDASEAMIDALVSSLATPHSQLLDAAWYRWTAVLQERPGIPGTVFKRGIRASPVTPALPGVSSSGVGFRSRS